MTAALTPEEVEMRDYGVAWCTERQFANLLDTIADLRRVEARLEALANELTDENADLRRQLDEARADLALLGPVCTPLIKSDGYVVQIERAEYNRLKAALDDAERMRQVDLDLAERHMHEKHERGRKLEAAERERDEAREERTAAEGFRRLAEHERDEARAECVTLRNVAVTIDERHEAAERALAASSARAEKAEQECERICGEAFEAACNADFEVFQSELVQDAERRAEQWQARAEGERWQPIKTAPKDGTWFLWCLEERQAVIRWPEYEACFEKGVWQSLPALPPPTIAPSVTDTKKSGVPFAVSKTRW